MKRQKGLLSLWKQIFGLLQRRQKRSFWLVLLILAVSAGLSQILPLAVGYLTDSVLADRANISFQATVPVLLVILVTSVANEVIKVIRRLLVEDASTQAEKEARKVDPNLLLRYRQIKQHVSPPMAKLVGNQCGGCFMTLPSASLKKIVSEDAVVECDNCGRILYAPEGE